MEPRIDLWRFDLLDSPEVCHEAAQGAAEADLVVVSTHGGAELPAGVELWLNDWVRLRGSEPCAMVLSLDLSVEPRADHAQPLVYLRALAERAGLNLFPHFGEVPRLASNLERELLACRAFHLSSTFDEILHRQDTSPH